MKKLLVLCFVVLATAVVTSVSFVGSLVAESNTPSGYVVLPQSDGNDQIIDLESFMELNRVNPNGPIAAPNTYDCDSVDSKAKNVNATSGSCHDCGTKKACKLCCAHFHSGQDLTNCLRDQGCAGLPYAEAKVRSELNAPSEPEM